MQQQVHFSNPPPTVTDRVLVRQTLAGDERAFEILVRRYHVPVFHFIRRYVPDYDQAWMCSNGSCSNSPLPCQPCAREENSWVPGSSAWPATAVSMNCARGA